MSKADKHSLSRRSFVGKLATGAAGAAVALGATGARVASASHSKATTVTGDEAALQAPLPVSAETAAHRATESITSAPAPWDLLAPLREGSEVTSQWRVKSLSEIVDGASVLTLENGAGRSQRIHLCRNDGRPQGLVYTDKLDMVVMNGGRGDLPTEEGFGQAVAQVAHVLASNEKSRGHAELVVTLLPQVERAERFADTARLR